MRRDYGWFRLAERLGMSLDECMERHTERQMTLWMVYLGEEMNSPDKVTSYLMNVACEVRWLNERVRTLMGGKIVEPKLEHFRIEFVSPLADRPPPRTKEEATGIAKAVWTSGLGLAVEHKTRTRTEARALGLID